ncbi:MAG TPA: T9SS type A sorting domain-containing protein [Saprospiraceae bacterium]|nr:T9SS type A sorting domain-containing protein [Saprospiraceae bacterium]
MKDFIVSIFILNTFFCLTLNSQPFRYEWARSFGGNQSEYPRLMKVDKNGDIYIVSDTESEYFSVDGKFHFRWLNSFERPISAFILKYSRSGSLLWGKAIRPEYGVVSTGLTVLEDNSIVISLNPIGGHLYLDSILISKSADSHYRTVIIKLSSEGEMLNKEEFYSNIEVDNSGGIESDRNGNLYLISKSRGHLLNSKGDTLYRSNLAVGYNFFLIKMDSNFNILWMKTTYNSNIYLWDLKIDLEDNIIVCGAFEGRDLKIDSFVIKNSETIYHPTVGLGDLEIFMLKLSAEGRVLWLKSLEGKDAEYPSYGSITFDEENNIYLSGAFESDTLRFNPIISLYKQRNPLDHFDIFYTKYDKSGECVWARQFMNGYGGLEFVSSHLLRNNYLVITGNYFSSHLLFGSTDLENRGNGDVYVLLARNDGEILGGVTIGEEEDEYSYQIASDANQVYILSSFGSKELRFGDGYISNDTTTGTLDGLFIKYRLDSLLSVEDKEVSMDGSVTIYPNPASESITVQLEAPSHEVLMYYNLYTINGLFVNSGILQGNPAEISVQHLPAGTYLLKGATREGKIYVGRFIKNGE